MTSKHQQKKHFVYYIALKPSIAVNRSISLSSHSWYNVVLTYLLSIIAIDVHAIGVDNGRPGQALDLHLLAHDWQPVINVGGAIECHLLEGEERGGGGEREGEGEGEEG